MLLIKKQADTCFCLCNQAEKYSQHQEKILSIDYVQNCANTGI